VIRLALMAQAGTAPCHAPLKPGSVTIALDAGGTLVKTRFVGYAAP